MDKQWTNSMHIVLYVGPCTVKTQSLNKPWGNTYLLTFVVGLQDKILHCQILRHDTTRHDTTQHKRNQKTAPYLIPSIYTSHYVSIHRMMTYILQDGLIPGQRLQPQPVTEVLQDGSVREVITSLVCLQDHLQI